MQMKLSAVKGTKALVPCIQKEVEGLKNQISNLDENIKQTQNNQMSFDDMKIEIGRLEDELVKK